MHMYYCYSKILTFNNKTKYYLTILKIHSVRHIYRSKRRYLLYHTIQPVIFVLLQNQAVAFVTFPSVTMTLPLLPY